ncbi:MAG TPA: c-type cytochrome [Anaeromyxobacteraceae bacterium]|nr:c-type cytochrome [Anaeromyxobacteraceae bacterium]
MKRIVTALFVLTFANVALADGAAIFKSRCALCHGPEGAGGKIMPRPIKGTPEAKVLEMIRKGSANGKMKPVSLADADAAAVAKYVSTLK